MKNIIVKTAIIAAAIVFSVQAPSKALSFSRSANSLISFQLVNARDAKITIRNSQGQVVKTMNAYSSTCNIETSLLQPGNYSYTITTAKGSGEGSFSVK